MKHTENEIVESICKWYLYMLENGLATKREVMRMVIGESWFKRAKAAIKGGLSRAGEGIKSAYKSVKQHVHDFFVANPGVKQMMKAISGMRKKGTPSNDIKLYVQVDGSSKSYPVQDFIFSKNRKMLALMFDSKKTSVGKTYRDLFSAMKENGIDGKKTKLSDFVDCLVVGEAANGKAYINEALTDKDTKRISGVVRGLNWKYKTATDKRQIMKLMSFLGIKDTDFDEVRACIKDEYSQQSDDESSSGFEEDSTSSGSEGAGSKKSSKEAKKDELQKAASKLEGTSNDIPMEAKDGYVGIMDCPFIDVRTDERDHIVCVYFDRKKADKEREQAEDQAVDD